MVRFEQTIEIPLELQKDENEIKRLCDEVIASEEILANCTDSGIVSTVTYEEYQKEYQELEKEEFEENEKK